MKFEPGNLVRECSSNRWWSKPNAKAERLYLVLKVLEYCEELEVLSPDGKREILDYRWYEVVS